VLVIDGYDSRAPKAKPPFSNLKEKKTGGKQAAGAAAKPAGKMEKKASGSTGDSIGD
jgi:hypothetical protein